VFNHLTPGIPTFGIPVLAVVIGVLTTLGATDIFFVGATDIFCQGIIPIDAFRLLLSTLLIFGFLGHHCNSIALSNAFFGSVYAIIIYIDEKSAYTSVFVFVPL
jgi:hypothetical protein